MICIWIILSILSLFCFNINAVYAEILWQEYDAKFLKSTTKSFYAFTHDTFISVPQVHSDSLSNDNTEEKVFNIYVRRFSHQERVGKHLWLISGGPGSSTSGIERALNVLLPDTAIYIMDNRGLGHSHNLCHHSKSKKCQKNPGRCYQRLKYDPKTISIHETAQDYNMISKMILEEEYGKFYMYGSSYGATLAYAAFKFDPKLYSGVLLEAFVPEFRLHEDIDVREHVINSCFASETCYNSIGGKVNKEDAMGMMEKLMNPETVNGCKSALDFLSQNNIGKNINSLFNSYIRVAFYKKTGLRPAFLPILYGGAYCPNLKEFNALLRDFHGSYLSLAEETNSESKLEFQLPQKLDNTLTNETHCSSTPNTNHFFGNHIRYSEYSFESKEKFEKCRKVGYLNSGNWDDVCGMVSDFKDDYSPYLYQPVVADPTFLELSTSPTRIVIVSGKMDTQTPHDLAEMEFNRLPVTKKFLFSADHGGHGIIDSWEVPGFGLDLILDFTMSGSKDSETMLRNAIENHNKDAERIWKYHDKEIFGEKDIWNLEAAEMEYNWKMFWAVVWCCLLPISLTYLIKRRELQRKLANNL